ncbi:NlpC/P60 family protein [Lentilactobacillus raoultii]|uniref:NlpC/P60 family protein n=1 Tax=Lentilactobacillus raoultii TaxID=1987503 RepID=A0ABW3PGI7_9LACO|nr:C40 family peptidase [Lentilactobacillus raoultii]
MSIKKEVALGLFSMASVFTLSQVAANADTKVTVKSGDTLYKIATKYHTTVNTLAKANHLKDANTIVTGTKLIIPSKTTGNSTATSSNSGAKKYTTGKAYTGKKKQTTSTYVSPSTNKQTSTTKSLNKAAASSTVTKSTKKTKQKTTLKANTAKSTTTGTSSSSAASGVTTLAQKLATQNIPYQWGGTTTKGFDCSGFVQYVFKQNGVSLPRTAEAQAESTTNKSVANAQAGDLLFWGSKGSVYHDAIYLGNNQYVNAPEPGQTVQVQTISPYFAPSFAGSVNA